MTKRKSSLDERILILAPTGRDGALIAGTLASIGLSAEVCREPADLVDKMNSGAALVLLAEEGVNADLLTRLDVTLRRQEPWSDFPFIVLSAGGKTHDQSIQTFRLLQPLRNLAILERPIHQETLISAVQTALRARHRQYETRAYLAERDQASQVLEERVRERTQEVLRYQGALHEAQKLEAIGRLAGGVAHDFNNLMTGILGIVEDVDASLGPESPYHSDLLDVLQAARKAAELTKQLLAFGRQQVAVARVFNPNHVIVEMTKLFNRIVQEDIKLETRLSPDVKYVKMDQSQLEQVLLNLILNARDAMPSGGKIVLESANGDPPESGLNQSVRIPQPARHVLIVVTDTGAGMDAETKQRIFEPFFTTKATGKGFGLGLATVYGIIKQHGGEILVQSELGQGTVFRIYLPVSAEAQTLTAIPFPAAQIPGGAETVLVVEDEQLVRRVVTRALKRAGYAVHEAAGPHEALAFLESFAGHIDLLLTDVVMPGMNGRELAQRVVARRPGTLVLFMSGHTEDVISHRGILDPGLAFISKSFSPELLCRKVREVLDSAKSNKTASHS